MGIWDRSRCVCLVLLPRLTVRVPLGCTTCNASTLAQTPPTTNYPAATNCAQRYAANCLDKGNVSNLKMANREQLGRGEDWDPVGKFGNPCSSQLVDAYPSYVSAEQKRVGVPVNQANPMLAHVLVELLEDMRSRAQLVKSLAQRIAITRDIALYSLAFASMRRGHDLSFTKGSQVLRLPQSRGLIFNFQFGKTLRKSSEAVVLLADNKCP